VGCIAGASLIGDYDKYLSEAGFAGILIADNKHDLNVYTQTDESDTNQPCCGRNETSRSCSEEILSSTNEQVATGNKLKALISATKNVDYNEFAGSFQIYSVKPLT